MTKSIRLVGTTPAVQAVLNSGGTYDLSFTDSASNYAASFPAKSGTVAFTEDLVDHPLSAGVITLPTYTDLGTGSVIIGNGGRYSLCSTATAEGVPHAYGVNGNTFALTDKTTNYIVVNYNSGTPQMQCITDVNEITEIQVIPVFTLYRHGTEIHYLDWDKLGNALSNKLHQSIVKTSRFRRQSGLALSEVATRDVVVGDGILWAGANKITLGAYTSTTDDLRLYVHVASVWTESTITAYDNTQYDDGTGLQTLSNNKYAVNFVYRCVDPSRKFVFITLGKGDYNLTEAQASQPQAPPAEIAATSILVGRIIVKKGDSTATQIDSAFVTPFTLGTMTHHEDLSDLLGGAAGEHYHLTSAQHTNLTGGSPTFTHINLTSATVGIGAFTGLSTTTLTLNGSSLQGLLDAKLDDSQAGTFGLDLLDSVTALDAQTSLGLAPSSSPTFTHLNLTSATIGVGSFTSLTTTNITISSTTAGRVLLAGTGGKVVDSANITATTAGLINVGDLQTTNSVDPMVVVSRTVNDSGSGNAHCFSDSSTINRTGTIAYNSFDSRYTVTGSNNYDHFANFQSAGTYGSSGTCTYLYGLYTTAIVNTGTVTNSYGVYVEDPSGTGTVVNNYGIRINTLTKGTTSNYAIYTFGATPSFFNGTVTVNRLDVGTAASPANLSINATAGLLVESKAGSTYDFAVMKPGRGAYVLRVPTGTARVEIPDTTDASALGTASIVTLGGASIAKTAMIGNHLVLPKTSGYGIKVDTTTPTWAWRDLTSDLHARGTGANDPAWAQVGASSQYAYSFSATVMQQVWAVYHVDHDSVPGADYYIHTHWLDGAAVPNTGDVVWGFELTYAKGYNQEAFNSSPIIIPVTTTVPATRYQHMISEVQCTATNGLINPAVVNVTINATSTTLTAASALFTAADIGRTITVVGAGAAGANLNTTIAGFTSTTQVTLTDAASTTVTAQNNYRHRVLDVARIETDGVFMARVYRDAANAADTCTDALHCLFADMHYQSTGLGTKQRNGPAFWT